MGKMELLTYINSGPLSNNFISKKCTYFSRNYCFLKSDKIFLNNKKRKSKLQFLNTTALLGPSGGFFGVGSSEVLVIGVVAYFILGPKRLYQLARDIGRISAEFKNVTEEARLTFQKAVDTDVNEKKEETVLTEKKKIIRINDSTQLPFHLIPNLRI